MRLAAILLALCLALSPTPAAAQTPRAATAERLPVTEMYEAVGTVRPRTEITIEAQVQAKILDVRPRAGQAVEKGDLLVTLDSRELRSRAQRAEEAVKSAQIAKSQALQAINSAKAAYDNAESDYGRIRTLFTSKTVTAQDMERADSAYRKAKAALSQAEEGLDAASSQISQAEKSFEEARVALSHTEIRAPEQGEIAKRSAEPGDLAFPGKTLLMLQTGRSLRLEALVREGLMGRISPGQRFAVSIPALAATQGSEPTMATVEEVVPAADPQTRTFLVKAGLPPMDGAYPGMFGRMLVPLATREAVMIPRAAVRKIGQIDMVTVLENGRKTRVAVKTGQERDGKVEVLSGLHGGETVEISGL